MGPQQVLSLQVRMKVTSHSPELQNWNLIIIFKYSYLIQKISWYIWLINATTTNSINPGQSGRRSNSNKDWLVGMGFVAYKTL